MKHRWNEMKEWKNDLMGMEMERNVQMRQTRDRRLEDAKK